MIRRHREGVARPGPARLATSRWFLVIDVDGAWVDWSDQRLTRSAG